MISTIVEHGDANARAQYLLNQAAPITHHLTPDPASIGIKVVQELVLALAITTNRPRLVWIEEAQTLTLEASNALLKLLEEPPSNTTIFLTCPNARSLLSTIRSRCFIHSLPITHDSLSITTLPSLKPLFVLSPGDRLQHLSDFNTDRTELLAHFALLASEIHTTITKTRSTSSLLLLKNLATLVLDTHQAIKSNVNTTLALSHFLLHLPKTK